MLAGAGWGQDDFYDFSCVSKRTSFSDQTLVLKRVHNPHDDEYCIVVFVFVTGGGAAAGCGIHGDNGG